MGGQFFIGLEEMFGDDPDLGKYWNIIGVSLPPGDNVEMEMALNPGPGYQAQVEADIETVRMHHPLEDGQGLTNLEHQVQEFGLI